MALGWNGQERYLADNGITDQPQLVWIKVRDKSWVEYWSNRLCNNTNRSRLVTQVCINWTSRFNIYIYLWGNHKTCHCTQSCWGIVVSWIQSNLISDLCELTPLEEVGWSLSVRTCWWSLQVIWNYITDAF